MFSVKSFGLVFLLALSVFVSAPTFAADSGDPLKTGVLRRGPDGKLYLDQSAAPPPAAAEQPAQQAPSQALPPKANAPASAAVSPVNPSAPHKPGTITVCASGCDAPGLTPALQSAQDGDTVVVKKGVYTDGGVVRANHITLRAEAGAFLKSALVQGKGAIVVAGSDTVIDGLDCSEIASPDRNGACIRMEGHTLTLRHVHFHDAEEGMLIAPHSGIITVEDSVLERLGKDGYAHAIYCNETDALIIKRSRILSSKSEGHEVKSRAARTVIEDSIIASLDGLDSRSLDIPNGGEVVLRNSVIEKGLNSSNGELIGYGLEGLKHSVNSLTLEGVTLILDRQNPVFLNGQVRPVFRAATLIGGEKRTEEGLTWYPDRAAAGLAAYPDLSGKGEAAAGREKAVALPASETSRSSKEKRVCAGGGAGCDYESLTKALREAETGSVIIMAPGLYAEAAVVRANHVTIKAEPGARLSGAAAEGKAALVLKGEDTVIESLECSGITVPDQNGACVRLEGRNLTLRHVYFHDSEQGLLANDDTGDISIEDSRFENLGFNGRAHAMYVNQAKSLTIRNTTVLSTKGKGHGIKTRAAKTLIEHTVVASLDSQDSRLIDASVGGDVVIRDCVLEKGPRSDNVEAIGYGLEGMTWPTNGLTIENTTFIMDRSSSALAKSKITGHMMGGKVIGGGNASIKRFIGKIVGIAFPGKIGDNLDLDGNVQWFSDREAAGLKPFPELPAR